MATKEAMRLYRDSLDSSFVSAKDAEDYLRKLKDMVYAGKGMAALRDADKFLRGSGIESLRSSNGRAKAYYVNMGDTYTTTVMLIKSPGQERIVVSDWGSWLEAQEARGNHFD